MSLVLGVPASLDNLIQDRTLERVFHDALFSKLLYRGEALPEVWPVNLGETQVFTRSGLLAPVTKPLVPGTDPSPRSVGIEQWECTASQYADSIDTHMPTSTVALASLFLRNGRTLGLGAGQSLNRLVRNALFKAYIGGHTALAAAAVATNTLRVASLNGFRFVMSNGRPVPISTSNPLPVTVVGTGVRNATSATPLDPNDPDGPGDLVVDGAAITAAVRVTVLSSIRSRILRSGGGDSVDALASTDILTLQDLINAVARLRLMNVPTFADGYYHVHLDSVSEAQLFADPAFQRLNTSLPEYMMYRDAAIGFLLGMMFYRNAESPRDDNSGALTATGGSAPAQYAEEIGGEVVNKDGVKVHRAIVLGQGTIYEKYLDEEKYITEAGVQGKVGGFSIVNNGLEVMTDRIRYIIRAPQDRLQQVVSQSWSWSGDFPVPSDITSGDAARFKRAVVVEHGE